MESCVAECPEECNSEIYELTLSSAQFPTITYGQRLIEESSFLRGLVDSLAKSNSDLERHEIVKRNVLALNVFYDKLAYTFIEESPKTEIADLISNIGGLAGLFLGVSFLSLLEVFEVIYYLVVLAFKKPKIKSSVVGEI
jgi:hypothetical protein